MGGTELNLAGYVPGFEITHPLCALIHILGALISLRDCLISE